MALTDKQRCFVDEYLVDLNAAQAFERLSALACLARHLGLIAPSSALKISGEELSRRIHTYGANVIESCLAVIVDSDIHPLSRAAAGLLLECFSPGWRHRVPSQVVGMVVERDDIEVKNWRSAVLKRDGYQCVKCGSHDELHAHHIVRWVDAPHLRIMLWNGQTLCRPCHENVHAKA